MYVCIFNLFEKKMKEKETKIVRSIQLEQSILKEIADLANKEDRSVNNMIKILLLLGIEARKAQS